jgi:hypothetical protein
MSGHVYRPDASGFCQAPGCSQLAGYCTGTKPKAQSDNGQAPARHSRAIANEPPPRTWPAEVIPPARRLVLTPASAIEPEPVVWAWEDGGYGRIPAGSVSLFAGREGTGKSCFLIWMAAKITRGELPGSFRSRPRAVIYVAVEDSWRFTIVPRLIASCADLGLVYRAEVVRAIDNDTVSLSLPADLRLLEEAVIANEVALIGVDPLMSAISDTIDTHVNRQVRQALDPLVRMGERTGAMVGGIAHFNKSGGTDASSLITGSGAFKDVARSIFAFAADDDGHVITQTKNNLGYSGLPSLAYRIVEANVPTAKGDAKVGRFVLDGQSERTVEDILNDQAGQDRDEKTRAKDYLRKALCDGPRPTRAVEEEGREAHQISKRTLERARTDLRIPTQKVGDAWWISLPEHEGDLRQLNSAKDAKTASPCVAGGDGGVGDSEKEETEMRTGSRTLNGRLPKAKPVRHAPVHCRHCLAEDTELDKGVGADREACEKRQPAFLADLDERSP